MILFESGKEILSGSEIRYKASVEAGQKLSLSLVCTDEGSACFDIDIVGEGAQVDIKGLYICAGESRANITVNLRHEVGGSISSQLFKGLVDDNARVAFDGKIVVAHDAQKTEAYQTNQNLQLSDAAMVTTSPQLEIYADDVKCSHGATVGSLNADEQFYMRSRGITVEEARKLQIVSFLSPVMAGLPEEIKESIASTLA